MREKINEKALTEKVISALVNKGGNVTVWTAGLAFSSGIMQAEAAKALAKLKNDAVFGTSAKLLLAEYKNT